MAGTRDSVARARAEDESLARSLKLDGANRTVVSDKLANELCKDLGVDDHERRAQLLRGVTTARKFYVAWVQNKWLQAYAANAIRLLEPLASAIEGGRWSTARKRLARITARINYNLPLPVRDYGRHTAQWLLRSASVDATGPIEPPQTLSSDAPETSEVERMIGAGDARAAPIIRAAVAKGLSFKKPARPGPTPDRAKDHVALMLDDAYRRATGKEPTRSDKDDGGSRFQNFVVKVLGDLTPGGRDAVASWTDPLSLDGGAAEIRRPRGR